MDAQQLAVRISQCVDDLGLLLDQIYKFPQKQRQNYFQKIQSLKNKLVILKGNLRQNNCYNIEKQYKQLYLSMNGLKNQINIQGNAISASKQNRDVHNRVKDAKEIKRNYDDAIKLIQQKDQEVSILNKQLYQKEELVKMNFDEINRLKLDLQMVCEQNRRLKFQHTTLQIDLQTAKASIGRTSDFAMEYKVRQQQKDKVFQSALDELQRLKHELIQANQKIHHFQQLAEISIKKTKLVEENIKKVQREAENLNQNYRMKENQNFRKLRQFGELQFQVNNKTQQIKQLQLQNRRFKEDILVLQNEMKKITKLSTEQRVSSNQQKQKFYGQLKRLNNEIENGLFRESDLKRVIDQWQKKYLMVIAKLNAVEELKVKNQQLQIKNQSIQDRLKRFEQLLQDSKRQNLMLLKDKQKVVNQMDSQCRSTREIQIQNYKFRQKVKMKDEERIRLIQDLEMYQSKLKEAEKALALHSISFQALEQQIVQQKTRVIKFEEKARFKDKQIQNLKIKLLKAKIQTIHQIREVIN